MGMIRKPGEVVGCVVGTELIEQQKWIQYVEVREPHRAADANTGPLRDGAPTVQPSHHPDTGRGAPVPSDL
jgi:hypothetical protein